LLARQAALRRSRLAVFSLFSAVYNQVFFTPLEVAMQAVVRRRLLAGALAAAMAAPALHAASDPKVTFTETKLKNGLRVIIAEDHSAPVFSIAVNYDVGSRNERKGRTGFAHLFEHMMFKGSQNVGPGEHFWLVFNNGGNMNGTTNNDRTLYFETLPSNQLDLGLFLEADRMRSLDITKDNLENQRNAVQEERRLGVDNQPYGRTFETVDALAYDNFAYEHSVIGSMADLSAASIEDVSAFFTTYYAPNNAVLAIVGDVDPAQTLAKVRRHFEGLPAQQPPPSVDMNEPPQAAERRETIDDPLARLARIDIAYKIPPSGGSEVDALEVLSSVVGSGRSSRLFENVVRQKQLAVNLQSFVDDRRGPGLFRVIALIPPGKTPADAERAIYEQIEAVKNGPIADWEMEKARNAQKRSFAGQMQSSLQRAVLLTEYAVAYNDPGRINTQAQRIAGVTAADVQAVAKKYLTPENRTVVVTTPKGAAPSPVKGGL
jgi:predicted Zn-dependent peptidase